MKTYLTYSLRSQLLTKSITNVIDANLLSAKNVRNCVIFQINNILTAYQYNKDSKSYELRNADQLHVNQVNAIELINKVIPRFNQSRDADKQYNLFNKQISSKTLRQLLDKSLIEHTIRHGEISKDENQRAYANTHSYISQMILQKTVDDYKHYFKSLFEYYKAPDKYTGRPQAPSYYNKNDRSTIEIDLSRLTKDGYLMPGMKKFKLFQEFPEKKPVSTEDIATYSRLNFRKLIEDDLATRPKKGTPVTIRFVSTAKRKHKVKIEYVIEFNMALNGICAQMEKLDAEFFNLKPEEQVKLVSNYYTKTKVLPQIMGIDLGFSNVATLVYNNGKKDINRVISSKGFIDRINILDQKIDDLKSKLAKNITGRAELIIKRLNKETLTKDEIRKLRLWDKEINTNIELCQLQKDKHHITQDYIQKLATGIINEATKNNMEFIVVGKNKLWKQELNLGSKTNRKGYNLPHARLIEVLRYKALLKGIVVLEIEESYTSKTSFITNEELPQYAPDTDGKINSQLKGKRSGHVFKIGNKKYHADINGAFNIIRKVFKKFAYHPLKISLSYILSELKMYGSRYFYDFNRKLYGAMATPSLT